MAKNSLVKVFDDLPWIVKIIFALPFLDFIWGIYRIIKGIANNNILLIVVGIIWIFLGAAIFWIIDLICVLIFRKVIFLA